MAVCNLKDDFLKTLHVPAGWTPIHRSHVKKGKTETVVQLAKSKHPHPSPLFQDTVDLAYWHNEQLRNWLLLQ